MSCFSDCINVLGTMEMNSDIYLQTVVTIICLVHMMVPKNTFCTSSEALFNTPFWPEHLVYNENFDRFTLLKKGFKLYFELLEIFKAEKTRPIEFL